MALLDTYTKSQTTKARTGVLNLARGSIQTPVFMPIGTQGSVKGLNRFDLEKLDAQIILGNTYHLWQRPGLEIIQAAGGVHNFTSWNRPMLTDSGGFQAFSLSKNRLFSEEGVTFRSILNGNLQFLSPEVSMFIQTTLGSDIALVLDECLPAEVTHQIATEAMLRTHRWAKRSKDEFEKLRELTPHQNILFGIPQGAQFKDLRKISAEMTKDLDFEGYSIGGVANGGEPEEIMYQQVLTQTEILEESKPKHLLGVGTPRDIVQMVACGIDMFDCVYPTRNARHGSLFFGVDDSHYQVTHIQNQRYEKDFTPINDNSRFPELRLYTKSYLRHLFKARELLAYRLATLHNLEFYFDLMANIRGRIDDNTFDSWWRDYKEFK